MQWANFILGGSSLGPEITKDFIRKAVFKLTRSREASPQSHCTTVSYSISYRGQSWASMYRRCTSTYARSQDGRENPEVERRTSGGVLASVEYAGVGGEVGELRTLEPSHHPALHQHSTVLMQFFSLHTRQLHQLQAPKFPLTQLPNPPLQNLNPGARKEVESKPSYLNVSKVRPLGLKEDL